MMAIADGVQDLKRAHPEWAPWLAVIEEVLREIADPKWDQMVPPGARRQQSKVPLLAEATLYPEKRALDRMFQQLLRIAGRSATAKMATLQAVPCEELDVLALFRAALNHDSSRIKELASLVGADAEAFHAVAALLPMPFLHACNRRWKRPESWVEGYCPICGAWPAFAEVRGIERSRYLRCGGCGSEWQAHCLFCPYCGMTDHKELASLVPEQSGSRSVIDACNRCMGYLKAFTTLQGSPPAKILLDDLASVELDCVAVERGYKRPQDAGYSLKATVSQNGAAG
jgi:FdhE protein